MHLAGKRSMLCRHKKTRGVAKVLPEIAMDIIIYFLRLMVVHIIGSVIIMLEFIDANIVAN